MLNYMIVQRRITHCHLFRNPAQHGRVSRLRGFIEYSGSHRQVKKIGKIQQFKL